MITIKSDSQTIKELKLCKKGFDLIEMGEKLKNEIKSDLMEIDITTVWGEIDYIRVENGMLDPKNSICKKVLPGKYRVKDFGQNPTSIFIGYTKDELIQHIVLNLEGISFDTIKNKLDSIYGQAVGEISGGMNGIGHKSYAWSSSGFDIYFSGLGNTVTFSYPKPKEYFDKLINGPQAW